MGRLPIKGEYPGNWAEIAELVKAEADGCCVRCGHAHDPEAGRTLTVHHFDGDKANCERWNLMPLCQACHLSVQGRVNPAVPLMFAPAIWSWPYVAGYWEATRTPWPIGCSLDMAIMEYEMHKLWPTWAPRPEPHPNSIMGQLIERNKNASTQPYQHA